MNFANDTAKNLLDLGLSPLFDTGLLKLYTTPQPTNADTAIGAQLLLATITLNGTAFGAAVDSSPGATATANAIAQATGGDTGTVTWARQETAGGSATIADLTVTTTGGGGDVEISDTSIATGTLIDVTSYTLFQPES